jgi:hypothetical protein
LHVFLWWSWFGKSQDSLNYSGAHLHSFWVSNTRNLYICILVFFFLCVCDFPYPLVILRLPVGFTLLIHSLEPVIFHPWPLNLLFMFLIELFYCLSRLKLLRPHCCCLQ